MKVKIETEILINASPDKVWAVLTDFEKYPEWNPFVKSLTGEVKVGNRIKVLLPGMTFKPIVLTFESGKEFGWLGHLLFKGLFDGEHSFVLVDHKNGTTTFRHSENFSGILVPLFKKQLNKSTKKGFEDMNNELKKRVENGQ